MRKGFVKILVLILLTLIVGTAWASTDWECWQNCMRAGGSDSQCRVICKR